LDNSSDLYVAKRLYKSLDFANTGRSRLNAVPADENTSELGFELERTYFIKFFLDWFLKEAEQQGVDVKTSCVVLFFLAELYFLITLVLGIPLDVSTVLLAREVQVEEDHEQIFPSPASGIGDINDAQVTWLLEVRRANSFKKWSGTNVHIAHPNNKLGAILTAFAHFIYHVTSGTFVISDMQSRCLWPFLTSPSLILFSTAATGKNTAGILCELLFDVGLHSSDRYAVIALQFCLYYY